MGTNGTQVPFTSRGSFKGSFFRSHEAYQELRLFNEHSQEFWLLLETQKRFKELLRNSRICLEIQELICGAFSGVRKLIFRNPGSRRLFKTEEPKNALPGTEELYSGTQAPFLFFF